MESALLDDEISDGFEKPPRSDSDPGETEDDEVKMNCIGGTCGMRDSDLSSDCDDDCSVEDDLQEEQGSREIGVVEFVTGQVQKAEFAPPIYRPQPVASRVLPQLSPQTEEPNEGSSEASESNDGDDSNEDKESSEGDISSTRRPGGSSSSESEKQETESMECRSDINDKLSTQRPSILQHLEALNSRITPLSPRGKDAEDVWQRSSSKAKRVLSSNTLTALNVEAGRNADSPKRIRSSEPMSADTPPEFSLGLSAMDQIRPLPRQSLMRDSPVMSSDEEDLDKRLSEELEGNLRDSGADNSPVPLLTPPQSPLTMEVGVCEWPSNLVVDSALMTAATDTRPLSPASLHTFEEAEEKRFANEATSLTPLLRSIYVGID